MVLSPLVPVRVGDLIEFSYGSEEDYQKTMLEGRVMDVDPATADECLVQVSPYEPFKRVDLTKVLYKVVYGIGEMTRVTPEMIGWELEIPQVASANTPERGVIKQVDSALNCALLAFDDGHKDWRDLTMNAFKVVGRHSNGFKRSNSPIRQATEVSVGPQPTDQAVYAIKAPIPATDAIDFDWYSEGGHVELCDRDGGFMEGALLCAQRDQSLQLYNEKRQFFEIQIRKQSFKVVIHGLVSVKSTVPLGQPVEIYSPMHGEFRCGTVMKVAEVGKLTPIRFVDVGLEWLDLTSQTFKLVFLIGDTRKSETLAVQQSVVHSKSEEAAAEKERTSKAEPVEVIKQAHHESEPKLQPQPLHQPPAHIRQGEVAQEQPSSISNRELGSPTRTHTDRRHHNTHKHTHQLPILEPGQTIELLDPVTKQFAKYRVTQVLHPDKAHQYEVEPSSDSGSSGSGLLRSAPTASLTFCLADVKSRMLLQPHHLKASESFLRGFRVDVYDKSDRSVLTGKIIDCSGSEEATDGGRVHVRLKDGSKRWFDVKTTKIKLKLQGERHASSVFSGTETVEQPSPSRSAVSEPDMWQRVDLKPISPRVSSPDEAKASILARQQSEKVFRDTTPTPAARLPIITRYASSPGIVHAQNSGEAPLLSRIPSLDFSSIQRSRAEPVVSPNPTTADAQSESGRSSGSNADALSDLLPPMDDVWTEEPMGKAEPMRYVHAATGHVQYDRPRWLKQIDETTGGTVILNTINGVRFQLPGGGSSSLMTSPATSGRAVVTLPVGPREAARVVSQLNVTAVDLCAQAFGT